MAAFDFPNSPSTNDVYTANGVSFKWNGTVWQRISASTGAQGATGPTGAQGATAAQGAQGATGSGGATGAQGATGPTGAQGTAGAQGAAGSSGSATLTNVSNNRVMTAVSGTTLNAEANLTFDGTTLYTVGDYMVKNPSTASYITHTFSSNFAKIDIRGTNIANSNHYLIGYGAGHSEANDLHFVNTVGDLVLRTNTERLRIASDGVATFSTTNINVNRNAGDAFIALQTSGTSNVSLYGGASSGFRVFTKPSGGSLTERIRIDSSGNFGIGTNNPSYKTQLSVSDTTAYSASTISANQFQLAITNSGAAGVAGILLATEPSSGNGGHCGIRALSTGSGDSALTFSTRGSATSAERLRIGSAGQIGLGGANYGSSGQVLTSQGSGSAATWAGAGKVLQTINATASSQVERTSSTFADTGLTANITLSAANKVLIFVAQSLEARQYNATGFSVGRLKLVRITSGTYYNIFGPGGRSIVTSGPGSGSYFIASGCIASIVAEDSPGVGTHTYATQIARTVGGGGTAVRANSDGHPAEIILMEVQA